MANSPGWFATTIGNRHKRCTDFSTASATILRQEDHQIAHGGEIDGIDDRPPVAPCTDQARVRKDEKLRGHRVWRGIEFSRNLPCCQAFRTRFHQQAKDLQPSLL